MTTRQRRTGIAPAAMPVFASSAEVAGLLIGFQEGQLEEPKAKAAAQLPGAGLQPG